MEELLYYIWTHKLFTRYPLKTVEGLSITVVDIGLRNRDSGPDFFNAKIIIDGILWVGNVEMHSHSSSWYAHKHHLNRAYDSTILHVVAVADREIYRTTGEVIPQLILPLVDELRTKLDYLTKTIAQPRCFNYLAQLDSFTIQSWLSALHIERLEEKCLRILLLLKNPLYQWRDVFFITLARNFGFGLNGEVFERWAMKLPFRAIDKHRDSLLQVESFFFGIAGLLEANYRDVYVNELQKEYLFLKTKFNFKSTDFSWQLAKLRPGNFPHLRIAQLAMLYHEGEVLLNQIIGVTDINDFYRLFNLKQSSYWETHYLFDKSTIKRKHQVSKRTVDLLIVNSVIPFLYALGKVREDDVLLERTFLLMQQLKPENNYITRVWEQVGVKSKSAIDSQGLIQLQKEYCDKKKCLYCRIGYYYLTNKSSH